MASRGGPRKDIDRIYAWGLSAGTIVPGRLLIYIHRYARGHDGAGILAESRSVRFFHQSVIFRDVRNGPLPTMSDFRESYKSIRCFEGRRKPAGRVGLADIERADRPRSRERRSAAGSRGRAFQRLHGDLRSRQGPASRPTRRSALGGRERRDGTVGVAGEVMRRVRHRAREAARTAQLPGQAL